MENYLFVIGIAAVLYFIASMAINLITRIRVKKGLSIKIKIVITDNETIVLDAFGHQLLRDQNSILYTTDGLYNNRIIRAGKADPASGINNFIPSNALWIDNFIENLPNTLKAIQDFGYQYITWYVLKSKREMGVSPFTTSSFNRCTGYLGCNEE